MTSRRALVSFSNVQSNLDAASPPAFVWVTPNAVDDMHDGPAMADSSTVPTVGDAWLANFIGSVQATSWYAANGRIIVQWDEGLDSRTPCTRSKWLRLLGPLGGPFRGF